MRVRIFDTHSEMSAAAGAFIFRAISEDDRILIAAATGETPLESYAQVARLRGETRSDLSRVRVIKLDEWIGVGPDEPGSCERYLHDHVIRPWGITSANYMGFRSFDADAMDECRRVREWLHREGPIGLSVLGLGVNGHIGFNEPSGALTLGVHIAELSAASQDHVMMTDHGLRAKNGITLGIGDIMASRRILLVVTGRRKSEPLARVFSGEITTSVPATVLRLHPDAHCYCDRGAAAMLPEEVVRCAS